MFNIKNAEGLAAHLLCIVHRYHECDSTRCTTHQRANRREASVGLVTYINMLESKYLFGLKHNFKKNMLKSRLAKILLRQKSTIFCARFNYEWFVQLFLRIRLRLTANDVNKQLKARKGKKKHAQKNLLFSAIVWMCNWISIWPFLILHFLPFNCNSIYVNFKLFFYSFLHYNITCFMCIKNLWF